MNDSAKARDELSRFEEEKRRLGAENREHFFRILLLYRLLIGELDALLDEHEERDCQCGLCFDSRGQMFTLDMYKDFWTGDAPWDMDRLVEEAANSMQMPPCPPPPRNATELHAALAHEGISVNEPKQTAAAVPAPILEPELPLAKSRPYWLS